MLTKRTELGGTACRVSGPAGTFMDVADDNTCEIRVGRLMEIRLLHGYNTLADVETMRERISQAFATLPASQSVVIAADWRYCRLMGAEASDHVGKMIGSFNARIERSGTVTSPDSPVAVLQFLRVIRESKHPGRKLFQNVSELSEYLGELLTPAEQARLAQFLDFRPS
jgi:hypothetical protein